MKADQDRVRMLITQTITMLCKKGLEFETELKVQGLLGITIDSKDIFLIHLNEKYDTVSDTRDVLQRLDSVATSTGHEKSQFSPQNILPDTGMGQETTDGANSEGYVTVKKESGMMSPALNQMDNQPTFTDLHESMSDIFPYSECHTTENASALLAADDIDEQGLLGETVRNLTTGLPSFQTVDRGKQKASSGVILLDSGDEGGDEYRGQFDVAISNIDSKSNLQLIPDNKLNIKTPYQQQLFKTESPLLQHQYSGDSELNSPAGSSQSSQSWALQPVSQSNFPMQSPGKVPYQSQQMQFERFGEFSLGHNRPPSAGQSQYVGRGLSPRKSPAVLRHPQPAALAGLRHPQPGSPGRAGVLSPTRMGQPRQEMQLRFSASPTAEGAPAMPPGVRGSTRARRPRGSGLQRVGASASASAVPAFPGASGRGGGGAAAQMSRGLPSVRTRSVDGFSYGKQTVTSYICNICNAVYKNHSSLLTHQVKVHGRQKKEGIGRPKMQPMEMYDDDDDDDSYDAEMDEMGNM